MSRTASFVNLSVSLVLMFASIANAAPVAQVVPAKRVPQRAVVRVPVKNYAAQPAYVAPKVGIRKPKAEKAADEALQRRNSLEQKRR